MDTKRRARPAGLGVAAVLAGTLLVASTSGASGPGEPTPTRRPAEPANTCTHPFFLTSRPNDGITVNGFYVHNNVWNPQPGGSQTLSVCSENSWYVEASHFTGTAVKSYPNVHKDINKLKGLPLSTWSTITSRFAGKGPGKGIYNVAYDVWMNGVGWANGHTEVMVWTENVKQRPAGNDMGVDYTAPDGKVYDVWRYSKGMNVVTFVSKTTQLQGAVDLKAMFDWAISRGYIPPNPTVHQIGYGIEFCDTAGTSRFFVSEFSLTME